MFYAFSKLYTFVCEQTFYKDKNIFSNKQQLKTPQQAHNK